MPETQRPSVQCTPTNMVKMLEHIMKDDDIEKRENSLELSQRVRHLEKFEFFLKDYVIDTSLLESIKQQSSQQHQKEQKEQEEPLK
ncbi:9354_t:CDS:2 [Entrophospora sp. SA101]|nr:9354_t:CDS:2 [Entrophospora sp. SA101]